MKSNSPLPRLQVGEGQRLDSRTAAALELLESRWALRLLTALTRGPARFFELEAAVPGVSRRMLTERLKEMQRVGLVGRVVDPGPPITSTYHLTPRGDVLRPALAALSRWAEDWHEARSAS